MGYVEYCIEYPNGETWSETRPFYDLGEMMRIMDPYFLEALTQEYRAKNIYLIGHRLNDEQIAEYYGGRAV